MHPVLFHLWEYPVKTYGVFVSLAHVFGLLLFLRVVKKNRLPLEPYLDMVFVVFAAGLLGSRLGYWAEHPGEVHSVSDFFALNQGGLSFFGGLAFAFPAYWIYLRLRGLPILATSDLFAPVLPLSLAVLRLGCFGAGCCHGIPTALPWGVAFANPLLPAAWQNVPLHPSPLYESCFLALLGLALFSWNAKPEADRKKLPEGSVATLCLGCYGTYRLFFDSLRGDMHDALPFGFSVSQGLALLLVLLAAATFAWLKKRQRALP